MAVALLMLGAAGGLQAAGLGIGQGAPDFALPTADGHNLRLSEYRGKVVMVNFWATWCGPCRQEMPLLDDIHQRYQAAGFELLGVNIDSDSAKATDMARALGVSFPVLLDSKRQVAELYRVNSMPLTVIVDRRGNLRYVHEGFQDGAIEAYLDQIRGLLKE